MLVHFVASSIPDSLRGHYNDNIVGAHKSKLLKIQIWVLDQSLLLFFTQIFLKITNLNNNWTRSCDWVELLLATHVTLLLSLFMKPFWKSNSHRQSEVQISNAIASFVNLNHFRILGVQRDWNRWSRNIGKGTHLKTSIFWAYFQMKLTLPYWPTHLSCKCPTHSVINAPFP